MVLNAGNKAGRHDRVRRQHQVELAQDYVEAIDELRAEVGEVRVRDLVRVFGVTHVTVIRTLERLSDQRLVERLESGGIRLTAQGRRMAREAADRHRVVYEFLRALGVSEASALADAEGIEHHLSQETLERMRRFVAGTG